MPEEQKPKKPFKPCHEKEFSSEAEAGKFVEKFKELRKKGEIPKWGKVRQEGKKILTNIPKKTLEEL